MGVFAAVSIRKRGSEISFGIFGLAESQTKAAAAGAAPGEAVHALGTHLLETSGLDS